MKARHINLRSLYAAPLLIALAAAPVVHAGGHFYEQHNLVSDGFVKAKHTDPNLVNSWGVAFNPFGPVWVADNGKGVSTLYDGKGISQPLIPGPLVVNIPSPTDPKGGGSPTGIVFNGSPGFVVHPDCPVNAPCPSRFIFATEDGMIAGWAPSVDPTHAISLVDNSKSGAVYKGLALSAGGSGPLLYATDFVNNKIDVFDGSLKPVIIPGAFTDPRLPAGFAPFGIQAISGDIYVSYAKQSGGKDEEHGKGLGFVNVFDPSGRLIRRVASMGTLNAPWGMALAPAGFGRFSNHLLVGNFGDGRINAYNLVTGKFAGQLKAAHSGHPIMIDGLWGLAFGNGFLGQRVNTLFFAAGPGDEAHGLYGRIDVDMTTHSGHHDDK